MSAPRPSTFARVMLVSAVGLAGGLLTGCEELIDEIVPEFETSLPPFEALLVPAPSDGDTTANNQNEQAACAEGTDGIDDLERRIAALNASVNTERALFEALYKTRAQGVGGVGVYDVEVGGKTLNVQIVSNDGEEVALNATLDDGTESRNYMTGAITDNGADGSITMFTAGEDAPNVTVSWTSALDGLNIVRLEGDNNTVVNVNTERTSVVLTPTNLDDIFVAVWERADASGAMATDQAGPFCFAGTAGSDEICDTNCTDELIEGLPEIPTIGG